MRILFAKPLAFFLRCFQTLLSIALIRHHVAVPCHTCRIYLIPCGRLRVNTLRSNQMIIRELISGARGV